MLRSERFRRSALATVPLDGIAIEVDHSAPPDEVGRRLEEFAQDLAQNRFADWGVHVDRHEDGNLHLVGNKGGTHFRAEVVPQEAHVHVGLSGTVDIGRLKLTLAGGPDGLRRRVKDEIERVLREHLSDG